VYDGSRGQKRFCGADKPDGIVAADDLRDLYLKYVKLDQKQKGLSKLNCTVSCSKRGQ
jgi:hypothetical protein